MDRPTKCSGCQVVAEALAGWSNGLLSDTFEVSLGSYVEFMNRADYCKACQFVMHHFTNDPSCHPFRPSCNLTFSRILFNGRFWIGPAVLCGRSIEDRDLCEEPHGFLELIPSAALCPTREHFVELDPLWINIQRIRLWPTYCDEHHHGSCHGIPSWCRVNSAPSITLIDVEISHLVLIHQPKRYVALSYVWGILPDILEANKDNFSQLQQAGSLNSKPWASRVPLTVRDAMYLTKAMGERYLWVDRLCIVQDDMEHKAEQLSFMSSIYANSYFTIIAADGRDANFGLRGVCKNTSSRSYKQSILNFSSTCAMMPAPKPETQFNVKEWHKRGWTYQERTLSNRNLVFFQGKAFWECTKAIWTEDLADAPDGVAPLKSSQRKPDRYSFESTQWPDLHQYAKFVGSYNNRLLTYQSDALEAFSAITSVLSQSFKGGFCHGIPELYFDYGLLWRPNTPAQRRPYFPSWSWVGWHGNIVFSCLKKSHQLLFDGKTLRPSIHIYPMCKWHKANKCTGELQSIQNIYSSFQALVNDCSQVLPPGWSRERPMGLTHASDPPDEAWIFKHESAPGIEFIHPIPMSTYQLTPAADSYKNEINFQTARCFLLSGGLLGTAHKREVWDNVSNTMIPYCLSFFLENNSGQKVGMIYSNFSDPKELMLGQECEVILISGGIANSDRDESVKIWLEEWDHIEDVKGSVTYEFYNVFWIERKGEMAYRKALGRVCKQAWQRQLAEEIDVILG